MTLNLNFTYSALKIISTTTQEKWQAYSEADVWKQVLNNLKTTLTLLAKCMLKHTVLSSSACEETAAVLTEPPWRRRVQRLPRDCAERAACGRGVWSPGFVPPAPLRKASLGKRTRTDGGAPDLSPSSVPRSLLGAAPWPRSLWTAPRSGLIGEDREMSGQWSMWPLRRGRQAFSYNHAAAAFSPLSCAALLPGREARMAGRGSLRLGSPSLLQRSLRASAEGPGRPPRFRFSFAVPSAAFFCLLLETKIFFFPWKLLNEIFVLQSAYFI